MFIRIVAACAAAMAIMVPSARAVDASSQDKVACDNQNKGKHENAAADCEPRAGARGPLAATARDSKSGRHAPGQANRESSTTATTGSSTPSVDAKSQRHQPGTAGEQ